jgi:large subunit ribosomal protein L21
MTTYAIISLGSKQYRVSEGQRLLVDRLAAAEGETITPPVLLVGGDGDVRLGPEGMTVTARVLGDRRGPKIRIGKYRKRTGYRRHTGFRAALTQIEIESIGGAGTTRAPGRAKAVPAAAERAETAPADEAAAAPGGLPEGYDGLTVAAIKEQSAAWEIEALRAAIVHEQEHAARKGALAALESALARKEAEG